MSEDQNMLLQLFNESVKQHTNNTAIVCGDQRISYKELDDKIIKLSATLTSLGIVQSDCVAIVLPNCPEFIISFFAIARLNGIVLPINQLYKEEEILFYSQDSNVKVIVTDLARVEVCTNVVKRLGSEIKILVIDDDSNRVSSSSEIESIQGLTIPILATGFDHDLLYQYSSGSTGRPKRVCRTQYNLYHEVSSFSKTTNITSADIILCVVPMFHAHGLGNCLLAAICNGATLVILEQFLQNGNPVEVPFFFRQLRIFELIQDEKITIFPAVPYILNSLAEAPPDIPANFSNLRLCFSAGNFLLPETYNKFLIRFNISPRQLYGCTEAGSISINLEENIDNTYSSVGPPLENVEIKIVDDTGNELPQGQVGEVFIKSKALTKGYSNMPELNQQVFGNHTFLTGDLGKIDQFGCLHITGRKKLLIDTGGHKVDPHEIEDILITHPNVSEAVVVGVKGLWDGERIKAVIVAKDRMMIKEQEIISFCRNRLAEFKVPRMIEFRSEIPKSPLGKILRKDLV